MKLLYKKLISKDILNYPWHIKNQYNWNMLKELLTEKELEKILKRDPEWLEFI
jgi:hypothetical protein